jgi:2-polyprenyl-3-methyl-5-hydroxy-6-metoxy-1,4-benzoquinol methylase
MSAHLAGLQREDRRPALPQVKTTTTAKPKADERLPFWERFLAWWEGYDPGKPKRAPVGPTDASDHGVRYEAARQRWETARLKLVQDLWGEGFSSPGDTEHILNMIKFFGLNPAMSVLDIGAGLGGATRTMTERFGVWVTGLEADSDLAEAGMALSTKAGMAKKAPITHFEPASFTYKPKSIDCVFSKEFLFTVVDKPAFLREVENLMKPRGQFLFTDYVLNMAGQDSMALQKWRDQEPNEPHAWTAHDYKQALVDLHLEVRVMEDISRDFHKLVTHAWANYIRRLEGEGITPEDTPSLVDELELWTRRIQALESGDLRVFRFHALKRDTDRLLSSW